MLGIHLILIVCGVSAGGQTHYVPTDYVTIQSAINDASNGDTILVEPGTYTGDGNRDISFFGKRITLRSVEGPEHTVIDSQGSPAELHGGFRLIHNETNEAVIDGFTVRGGYLIGDTGGSGPNGGGGGAGIFIRRSSPTIRNCIIRDNRADRIGSNFVHDGVGAGIYFDEGSLGVIENCIILDNHAGNRGGGVAITSFPINDTRVFVRNCIIALNSAIPSGGGIYVALSNPVIQNTSIVNNVASISGGALLNEYSETLLSSSIIWGNTPEEHFYLTGPGLRIEYSLIEDGIAGIDGCCDHDFEWGPGNTAENPQFVPGKTYRPSKRSPCLDAGSPMYIGPALDVLGGTRVQNYRIDMGAIESPHAGAVDCNANQVSDSIDIGLGQEEDCNINGIPDSCDIMNETSEDADRDSVPDECPVFVLLASNPPDGAMDARQPTNLDGSGMYGWDRVELEFFADMPPLSPRDFEVLVSGGDVPRIDNVSVSGRYVTVALDRPITPGECTTIRMADYSHISVSLQYHPCNTNAEAGVNTVDVLDLIDHLSGELFPRMQLWQCDLNRSGTCEPSDILRFIDMRTGAESYERCGLVPVPVCP